MAEPLAVSDLRPTVGGEPFPGTELPPLAEALAQVDRWIDRGRPEATEDRWIGWPDRPDFRPIYGGVSLNTGTAGIAWYALNRLGAAEVNGDPTAADWARDLLTSATDHVVRHWRDDLDDEIALGFSGRGTAYYGGLAGIAAVLVAAADRLEHLQPVAADIVAEVLARQQGDGTWTSLPGLMGDAGIAMALLGVADRLGERRLGPFGADDLRAVARATGERLLAAEQRDEHGSYWIGTPADQLGLPGDRVLDGFELGTVGVAFLLARLATATGVDRFVEAAARGADHTSAVAVVRGDAAVLPRMGGDYSFGYCTGSSGVARSYLAVHRATGDPAHLDWALRFGRGILRSGVPGRQTPGNGYVLHQCCGSAAVLETFVGLSLESDDPVWRAAARAQADDLLIRSVNDGRGRRWYSESHILPAGQLKAEIGHQVGASGIALALLRHQQHEQAFATGTTRTLLRLPDDPYRETARPGS